MSKFWIRLIAILEITGGVCGIVFQVPYLLAAPANGHPLMLAGIVFAIYLLSLVAGVTLLLERRFGRLASIVIQAIQLPKYMSQLLIFMFSFGVDAYLYGMLTNNAQPIFGFEFKFLAFNQLFVNVADAPAGFGISIPACIFLARLIKYRPEQTVSDDGSVSDAGRTEQIVGPEGVSEQCAEADRLCLEFGCVAPLPSARLDRVTILFEKGRLNRLSRRSACGRSLNVHERCSAQLAWFLGEAENHVAWFHSSSTQQVVGRERRKRISQLA